MPRRDFTRSLLSFLQNPTPSKRDTLPPLFLIYKGERGKKDRIIEERKEEFISLYYKNFEVSIYFDIYLLFEISIYLLLGSISSHHGIAPGRSVGKL